MQEQKQKKNWEKRGKDRYCLKKKKKKEKKENSKMNKINIGSWRKKTENKRY